MIIGIDNFLGLVQHSRGVVSARCPAGASKTGTPIYFHLSEPVTEADIVKAEEKLGFALLADLKSFFLPSPPKCRAECAELYTLREAVKQYRMVTKSPYGPNGQDWPRELFPFCRPATQLCLLRSRDGTGDRVGSRGSGRRGR